MAWKTTPGEIARYIDEFNVPYPIGHDRTEEIFRAYRVPYQPESVFVTRTGKVLDQIPGGLNESFLRQKLSELLEAA